MLISSSPRRGGNFDLLCDRLSEGAGKADHQEEKICFAEKKIRYCAACYACRKGTLTPLPEQIAKIRALADLKRNEGLDFVINARTCAYWLDVGDETEKLRIAGKRGNVFAEAGAVEYAESLSH